MACRAFWLLALVTLGASTGCGRRESSAGGPSYATDSAFAGGQVADFRLAEARGGEVALADLAGQPFVMDFVFTTCTGPCPTLSANMRALQDDLAGSKVRLVTVSVDPELDTLEQLALYAERHDADPERWKFLRAEPEDLARIARSVALAVQSTPEGGPGLQVTHSTRFVVVDGKGIVRGYYPGEEPEGRKAAARRARWLEKNPGR